MSGVHCDKPKCDRNPFTLLSHIAAEKRPKRARKVRPDIVNIRFFGKFGQDRL